MELTKYEPPRITTLKGASLTRLAWYKGVYRWQWGPFKEPDWLLKKRLFRAVLRSARMAQPDRSH